MTDRLDEQYHRYASPSELEALKALDEHGWNVAHAAKALGRTRSTLQSYVARVRQKAARQGYAPEHGMETPSPEGTYRARTSTLWKTDEKTGLRRKVLEWEISKPEHQREAAFWQEFAEGLACRVRPAPMLEPPPGAGCEGSETAVAYVVGDAHIGAYAWAAETGQDFDVNIAAKLLHGAMIRLVEAVPRAETGVIVNVGDFVHSDNSQNKTLRSGHVLDVDTRWAKVMKVAVDALLDLTDLALSKHKRVVVRNAIGNHDTHASTMLSLVMEAYYKDDPRVLVETSPDPFWYWRFGETLVGVTHADGLKLSALPGIMATDRARDWGETRHRYWYTGHVHHRQVEEHPGVVCESFRTLAARDAWTHSSGYRAGRDMTAITLHERYGEIGRSTVNTAMISPFRGEPGSTGTRSAE